MEFGGDRTVIATISGVNTPLTSSRCDSGAAWHADLRTAIADAKAGFRAELRALKADWEIKESAKYSALRAEMKRESQSMEETISNLAAMLTGNAAPMNPGSCFHEAFDRHRESVTHVLQSEKLERQAHQKKLEQRLSFQEDWIEDAINRSLEALRASEDTVDFADLRQRQFVVDDCARQRLAEFEGRPRADGGAQLNQDIRTYVDSQYLRMHDLITGETAARQALERACRDNLESKLREVNDRIRSHGQWIEDKLEQHTGDLANLQGEVLREIHSTQSDKVPLNGRVEALERHFENYLSVRLTNAAQSSATTHCSAERVRMQLDVSRRLEGDK